MKKGPTAKTPAAGGQRGPGARHPQGGHQQDAPPMVQTIRQLQRTAGNAAVGEYLQRQVAAPAAEAPGLALGPFRATTYDGLLALGRFGRQQLTKEAAELPEGEQSRVAAESLAKQMQAWEPYLEKKGNESLDDAVVGQAKVWQAAYIQARRDMDTYKSVKARRALEKAAEDAEKARKEVEKVEDSLADYKRGAFLAKNHKLLEKLTGVSGKVLEVTSALLEVHEKCMKMVGWLGHETTHVDEVIEKFGPIAEGAHKVLASYEGLESALNILRGGEGATEIDKEMSRASSGLKLAEAAASLTGVGAAYVLYFGVILSVGEKCLEVVGVIIREHNHELNKLEIVLGNYDSVDWSVEPGGRETFEFMTKVMRVRSPLDLPDGIPHAVDELMVESKQELEEGTGEEVPLKGFWFWKHANEEKARYWVFKNRKNVWRLLYGSISPPP